MVVEKGPTPSGFFSCIFVINDKNHDCRLLLEEVGSILPGNFKKSVPIKFLCPELVLPKLQNGAKFYLRDGKIVAEGKVNEMINKKYMA
jgi:hypothetical protein